MGQKQNALFYIFIIFAYNIFKDFKNSILNSRNIFFIIISLTMVTQLLKIYYHFYERVRWYQKNIQSNIETVNTPTQSETLIIREPKQFGLIAWSAPQKI